MNTSNLYKELSYCELKPIIKKHFNQDEFEFSLLKGGMFNTTYLIFLISTGVKYVLRLGPINRQLLLPYELNLMNGEKYFYELCAKEHIPFSKIIVCETDKLLIDRDYMIVEYIDSSSLSERISCTGMLENILKIFIILVELNLDVYLNWLMVMVLTNGVSF